MLTRSYRAPASRVIIPPGPPSSCRKKKKRTRISWLLLLLLHSTPALITVITLMQGLVMVMQQPSAKPLQSQPLSSSSSSSPTTIIMAEAAFSTFILPLHGPDWVLHGERYETHATRATTTFTHKNKQQRQRQSIVLRNVTVPGQPHVTLLAHNIVDTEPYFRFNDLHQRWITLTPWRYERPLPMEWLTRMLYNCTLAAETAHTRPKAPEHGEIQEQQPSSPKGAQQEDDERNRASSNARRRQQHGHSKNNEHSDAAPLTPADCRVLLLIGRANTVLEVSLNSMRGAYAIGRSVSAFRTLSFDVPAHLLLPTQPPPPPPAQKQEMTAAARKKKEKALLTATLELQFYPSPTAAQQAAMMYPAPTPLGIPPQCPPPIQHGFCHFNFLRTPASSFAWDWGPAFAPQGVTRAPVALAFIAPSHALLVEAALVPMLQYSTQAWMIQVNVWVQTGALPASATIRVSVPDLGIHRSDSTISWTESECRHRIRRDVMVFLPDGMVPKLWWPRGYGKPYLYEAHVLILPGDGDDKETVYEDIAIQAAAIANGITKKIGFRTLSLERPPMRRGTGMHFKVNGMRIYAKGANLVPIDAFEERVTEHRIRSLLQSAVNANMNILRVWGGGLYQHPVLYDVADELGLLIWQEFMFACALYPVNEAFLDDVRQEVIENVNALKSHASILVWSGNNENEVGLAQNWWNTKPGGKGGKDAQQIYEHEYSKLMFGVIAAAVAEVDASRPFIISSPSNGNESAASPVAADPQSEYDGDVHFYDYAMDCWDTEAYPIPRFASEFGFQSRSSFRALSRVSIASDRRWGSRFMDHRQHHPDGDAQIMQQIALHFRTPPGNASDGESATAQSQRMFRHTLLMTHIMQAMCLKAEAEHYRRYEGRVTADGRGDTGGSLYWQLNSIWPGASWSSLVSDGSWKMSHYFARRFYAPVVVSPVLLADDVVEVWVVGDGAPEYLCAGMQPMVVMNLFKYGCFFDSWKNAAAAEWNVTLPNPLSPGKAVLAFRGTLAAVLARAPPVMCPTARDCLLRVSLVCDGASARHDNSLLLSSPKNVTLLDPKVAVSNVVDMGDGTFEVTVTSDAVALFVWLSVSCMGGVDDSSWSSGCGGEFSDNGFDMTVRLKAVRFSPFGEHDWTTSKLLSALDITSLFTIRQY